MRYKLFLLFFLNFIGFNGISQINIELVSRLNLREVHDSSKVSDVWGYVDKTGIEYAIVGIVGFDPLSTGGVSVISLQDPKNPKEVAFIEGSSTTWWDMKTWNSHLYIVNEGGEGLTIADLSGLPESVDLPVNYYTGPSDSVWTTAHNIYIDSTGFAYIFGANRGNSGAIFLDLNKDPKKPEEVGAYDEFYVHDGYAYNQKLYVANVLKGFFTILDVEDKANPKILGKKNTPFNFSHNIWVSKDEKIAFTTDEKRGAFIASYNIEDPSDAKELGRIRSEWSENVIPHNTHLINNYLVTSYYRDGLIIHDVSDPSTMVEVGSYDTHPWFGGGFNGCWGAYPYLPSGLILASDIERGLFVLKPNYQRAGFLEGVTYDKGTGNKLKGVEVILLNTKSETLTNVSGEYNLGIYPSGTFDVVFNKLGYYPDTIRMVKIEQGKATILIDSLTKQESYSVKGVVKDSLSGVPIADAEVRFEIRYAGVIYDYLGKTDSLGEFVVDELEDAIFRVFVGKWGYKTFCVDTFVTKDKYFEIPLPKGYYDDFSFDFGWEVEGPAKAKEGKWERGIPKSTIKVKNNQQYYANPNKDIEEDCGAIAFVTGNSGEREWDDDLDGSKTILLSPEMDLTEYTDPYISYYRWFFEATYFSEDSENDTLKVFLIDKEDQEYLIDKLTPSASNKGGWFRKSFRLNNFVNKPKEGYRLKVVIMDWPTSPNAEDIVEAGLDYFMVTEGNPIGILEVEKKEINVDVSPNPFSEQIVVRLHESSQKWAGEIEVFDFFGRSILSKNYNSSEKEIKIDSEEFPRGIYFLRIKTSEVSKVFKLLKY